MLYQIPIQLFIILSRLKAVIYYFKKLGRNDFYKITYFKTEGALASSTLKRAIIRWDVLTPSQKKLIYEGMWPPPVQIRYTRRGYILS